MDNEDPPSTDDTMWSLQLYEFIYNKIKNEKSTAKVEKKEPKGELGKTETLRELEIRKAKLTTKRVECEIKMDDLVKKQEFIKAEQIKKEIESLKGEESDLSNKIKEKKGQTDESIKVWRPKRKTSAEKIQDHHMKIKAFLSENDDSVHGLEIGYFGEKKGRGIKVVNIFCL